MSVPFHSIPASISSAPSSKLPLFIFGDHASRHIPPAYNNLGLKADDLTRHIAWDIGTEGLVRTLCARFGCAGHLAGFSRLLIDPNRALDMACLIPETSDGTDILSNQSLSPAARQARIDEFYTPYHNALEQGLDAATHMATPFIISMHSFTPHPHLGARRQVDIGLLVKHDAPSALAFKTQLTKLDSSLKIRMNEPYSAYDLNYTVDTHVAPRALAHLAIEVRQDHLMNEAAVAHMAKILGDALMQMS